MVNYEQFTLNMCELNLELVNEKCELALYLIKCIAM